MKRVFIIHGWLGYPQEGWFPWLKKELEARGFEVLIPRMPDVVNPKISTWVAKIAEIAGTPDEDTYFVGHSIGCQAIARYLETLSEEVKIGGVVFVAGFFKRLSELVTTLDIRKIAAPWLNTPVDFLKIKKHLNKSVAIFSDNDPLVPLDNQDDFRDKLGSKIIIEKRKWHLGGATDIRRKLPVVLENILNISK